MLFLPRINYSEDKQAYPLSHEHTNSKILMFKWIKELGVKKWLRDSMEEKKRNSKRSRYKTHEHFNVSRLAKVFQSLWFMLQRERAWGHPWSTSLGSPRIRAYRNDCA